MTKIEERWNEFVNTTKLHKRPDLQMFKILFCSAYTLGRVDERSNPETYDNLVLDMKELINEEK